MITVTAFGLGDAIGPARSLGTHRERDGRAWAREGRRGEGEATTVQ